MESHLESFEWLDGFQDKAPHPRLGTVRNSSEQSPGQSSAAGKSHWTLQGRAGQEANAKTWRGLRRALNGFSGRCMGSTPKVVPGAALPWLELGRVGGFFHGGVNVFVFGF